MGIFKSINFWVSLVNILLSVLVLAGATIPADTGKNREDISVNETNNPRIRSARNLIKSCKIY